MSIAALLAATKDYAPTAYVLTIGIINPSAPNVVGFGDGTFATSAGSLDVASFRGYTIGGIFESSVTGLVIGLLGAFPINFFRQATIDDADDTPHTYLTEDATLNTSGNYTYWTWAGISIWSSADAAETKNVVLE
jgi:hypothetical protein